MKVTIKEYKLPARVYRRHRPNSIALVYNEQLGLSAIVFIAAFTFMWCLVLVAKHY